MIEKQQQQQQGAVQREKHIGQKMHCSQLLEQNTAAVVKKTSKQIVHGRFSMRQLSRWSTRNKWWWMLGRIGWGSRKIGSSHWMQYISSRKNAKRFLENFYEKMLVKEREQIKVQRVDRHSSMAVTIRWGNKDFARCVVSLEVRCESNRPFCSNLRTRWPRRRLQRGPERRTLPEATSWARISPRRCRVVVAEDHPRRDLCRPTRSTHLEEATISGRDRSSSAWPTRSRIFRANCSMEYSSGLPRFIGLE